METENDKDPLLWDVRIRLMLCVETRRVTARLSDCCPMLHCIKNLLGTEQILCVSRHIASLMGREQGDLEKSGRLEGWGVLLQFGPQHLLGDA